MNIETPTAFLNLDGTEQTFAPIFNALLVSFSMLFWVIQLPFMKHLESDLSGADYNLRLKMAWGRQWIAAKEHGKRSMETFLSK